jgi:hypothetical protein
MMIKACSTFVLIQKNQILSDSDFTNALKNKHHVSKSRQRRCFLCHTWPLPCKSGKTTGTHLDARLTHPQSPLLHQAECPFLQQGHYVLPDFTRKRLRCRRRKGPHPALSKGEGLKWLCSKVLSFGEDLGEAYCCTQPFVTFLNSGIGIVGSYCPCQSTTPSVDDCAAGEFFFGYFLFAEKRTA